MSTERSRPGDAKNQDADDYVKYTAKEAEFASTGTDGRATYGAPRASIASSREDASGADDTDGSYGNGGHGGGDDSSDASGVSPREQRELFFRTLLRGQLPPGLWTHVWRPSPKYTKWVRTPEDAEASGTNRGWRDAYICIGLAGKSGKPTERLLVADSAGLLGFGGDIDIKSPVHKQADLPPNDAAALALVDEFELPPTLVVHSGHGLQAWWLFKEPWRFADNADRQRAISMSAAWQRHIGARAGAHGWKLDSVGDVVRLLRIPGTHNAKMDKVVVPVRLLRYTPSARYLPQDFADVCTGDSDRVHTGSGNVTHRDRFKREHPCPVCGGYEEMEKGIGERCWGFISKDGNIAFCVRAEWAGSLEPVTTSLGTEVYPHKLWGPCDCGMTHATEQRGDGPVAGRALWNARYFASLYQDRLRHVPSLNRWLENNGKWWEPNDDKIATRLGYAAVDELYTSAANEQDRAKKRTLSELAVKLDSPDKIAAMISAAGTFPPIVANATDFDTDDYAAVAANGVIDLRTGALRPHNTAEMHSKHLGPTRASIVYDADATCPRWLEQLDTVFQGDIELITFIQRAFGLTLTGDTSEEVWFPMVGGGNNGKSTISRALYEVLGTYADTLPPESLLETRGDRHPTDIAGLVAARGVFVRETSKGARLAANRVKELVANDEPLKVRFMRQDFFKYTPKLKLWLHTNNMPVIRDTSNGTWRRIRPIPFNYTFQEVDRHFYDTYLRPELPGILAWIVAGCLEWQRYGLPMPDKVAKLRREYQKDSDVLAQFLQERIYARDDAFLPSAQAYSEYCQWCRMQGDTPETQAALSLAIKNQFHVDPVLKKNMGRGFPGLDVQQVY